MTAKARIDEYLQDVISRAWSERQRRRDETAGLLAELEEAIETRRAKVTKLRATLAELDAELAELKGRMDARKR